MCDYFPVRSASIDWLVSSMFHEWESLCQKCERKVDFGGRFPVEVGMELFVSPCYILLLFFLCPPLPSPRELSGIGPSLSIELESSFEGGYEVSIFVSHGLALGCGCCRILSSLGSGVDSA